jgi:hypothetical protein
MALLDERLTLNEDRVRRLDERLAVTGQGQGQGRGGPIHPSHLHADQQVWHWQRVLCRVRLAACASVLVGVRWAGGCTTPWGLGNTGTVP